MARLLVRLKVRLLVNGLERGPQQAVGLVLSAVLGLLGGVVGAVVLARVAERPDFDQLVIVVFAAVWLGWLLLPALTFSSDETLDPRRFALLPLRHRELVPGLLAAGLVGVGPIATAVAASGAVIGVAAVTGSFAPALVAAVAAVLLVVTSVAWSRAVLTAASHVLGSRRGRDVLALAAGTLGVGTFLVTQAITRASLDGAGIDPSTAASIAVWSPGGAAGAAVGAAARGQLATAGGALLAVVAATAVALWLWQAALGRLERRSPSTTRSGRGTSALYPRWLRWLPRGRTTAVGVRFLRDLTRDPRVRTQAIGQLFTFLPVIVVLATAGAFTGARAPFAVAAIAPMLGLLAINQLGLDGPALWLHEVTGADAAADLRGRDLAVAAVAAPVVGAGLVVAAMVSSAWPLVPAGVLVAAGALAASLGVANVAAVLLPIPISEGGDNVFGSQTSGQGCVNGVLQVLVVVGLTILLLPVFVPPLVVGTEVAATVAAVGGLVYGCGVWWAATRVAVASLTGRGPELLTAVEHRT